MFYKSTPDYFTHLLPLPPSPSRCLFLPVSVLPAWLVSREERNPLLLLEQTGTDAEEARPLGSNPRQGGACGDSHSRISTAAGRNTFRKSKFATTETLLQNPPSLYSAKLGLKTFFKISKDSEPNLQVSLTTIFTELPAIPCPTPIHIICEVQRCSMFHGAFKSLILQIFLPWTCPSSYKFLPT